MKRRNARPRLRADRLAILGSRRAGLQPSGGVVVLAVIPLIPLLIILALTVSVMVGCADQKKQAEGLVRVALQHRDSNRHAEAIRTLNRALALNPKLSEAWFLRGLSYAALNHGRESVADLTTAVRLNPGWDEAWLTLGVAQRSTGEKALAIKSFSEAIRLNSHLTAAWFDRACVYSETGNDAQSLQDLDAVLRLEPAHEEALLRHARALMNTNRDEAIGDLSSILSRNRGNAEAWLHRGLCWHLNGDSDRALADLNTACRLQTDNYRPWLERGRVLRRIGRAEDAVSDLTTAVQLAPAIAECHFELAMSFQNSGNTTAFAANLDQVLALDPNHTEARLARAGLSANRGEHEAAIKELNLLSEANSATMKDPELAIRIRLELSRSLHATGEYDKSLQELAPLLEANPSNRNALRLRAEVLKSMDRSEEAVAAYTNLISLSSQSQSAPFLLQRAKLHLSAERWDDALEDLAVVLMQDPDSTEALATRSLVYSRQGQDTMAVADLTHALKVEPNRIDLLRQRSAHFEQLGEPAAALADLERVIDLQPCDEATTQIVVSRLRNSDVSKAIAVLDRLKSRNSNALPLSLALLRSDLLLQNGDFDAVEKDIASLNETASSSPHTRILRARLAIARGQDPVAIEELNHIADADITGEVHYLRGSAFARLGDFPKASDELTKSLRLEPDNAAARLARAAVFTDLHDWKNALADATEILSSESHAPQPQARMIRGESLFHLRHYRDALEDLDSIEVRRDDSAKLQWMRCQCLCELDQVFRAREELHALIAAEPAHEPARMLRAKLAEQQGEYDLAIADLSAIIARQPGNSELIMQRGLLLHRRARFAEAMEDFTRVLILKPDSPEVYYRRGLARHQLRQAAQATADLDQCLKLNPAFVDAIYVKGNIVAGQGNVDEALELYRQALGIAPDHAAAWYNRGNLLFNNSRLEEAIDCWTHAIDAQPNLFRAYNNRAAALAKLARNTEAVRDYEKALEISPGFARAWDNYAWLLATSEDPVIRDTTRAVFMAKRACELTNFNEWSCLSTLAAAYAEAGDFDQAVSWAEKSKVVAPADRQDEIDKLVKTYGAHRTAVKNSSTAVRNRSEERQ